jgi:hypothetical protein
MVVGLKHIFPILGRIIPADQYFFRGVETTNQIYIYIHSIIFHSYIYICISIVIVFPIDKSVRLKILYPKNVG